ncbi:hypothetical protein [Paraburkholderia pallida]|uniref:Uncharacterized protein n=1 Tax=Paraburkholderia pallida TaxID=2547399 RepID=A0A4P7D997_9BURK|nr:hypothetical protein [Paraburkholderia pallida]QBR04017.1 hypothetical protein E1956_43250 [Paraburkholderia pallida]
MHSHDEAVRELAHICTMVLRLEQLVHSEHIGRGTVVTSPDYWRARVKATAKLAPQLQQQAGTLLARLDAIDSAIQRLRGRARVAD